ncbi:MAG: hypothetical protein ACLP1X_23615 [Polyangiaceae bacterium]|jgi:hypothetical protein
MQHHLFSALAMGALAFGSACQSQPRAAVRAADIERAQCEPGSPSQDELVRSIAVLQVRPALTHMRSNTSGEERVNGAKLLVRPPHGMSAVQLGRILQCHGARALLGQVNGGYDANDPYWLPDAWVSIDVRAEDGNFAVTLSADTVRDNLRVYGRANHYADEHVLATGSGLP